MNVIYLLTTVTQIETAPILMDLSCALVIVYLKERKLFVKINRNFFSSVRMKQSDWLRNLLQLAGFLHPARSETQMPALVFAAKN